MCKCTHFVWSFFFNLSSLKCWMRLIVNSFHNLLITGWEIICSLNSNLSYTVRMFYRLSNPTAYTSSTLNCDKVRTQTRFHGQRYAAWIDNGPNCRTVLLTCSHYVHVCSTVVLTEKELGTNNGNREKWYKLFIRTVVALKINFYWIESRKM